MIHGSPVRPIMRYHGSKYRIAPWLLQYFPPHEIYIEPYGGGASVLMAKPRVRSEVYNDLDEEIVNLFKVLRDDTQATELIKLLELTPYSRCEFYEAYEPGGSDVERARKTLVRSHMGFGSAGATKNNTGFRSDSSRTNAPAAMCWQRYPNHVRSFIERLRGVCIDNRPALDIFRLHDDKRALFYVDPPYLPSTRMLKNGTDCYRHEMNVREHIKMLRVIKQLAGMVVLSGYDNSLYDRLLPDWSKRYVKTKASGNRGAVDRVEVIWMSPRCADSQKQIELMP